jgi:hypothetical protein
MQDPRIWGTWRSDAGRTAREIAAWKDIPAHRSKKLITLFGKLEPRYTRTRCYATLNGQTEVLRYKVVAKDSGSVALVSDDPIGGRPVASHVHFDGPHFWINIGNGRLREFFKRQG